MLRKNYLNGKSLRSPDRETPLQRESLPFEGDSLEVFHYVDHRGLTPALDERFRSFNFYEEHGESRREGRAFAVTTVLGGFPRMGSTREGWRFTRRRPFFVYEKPFLRLGNVDSGKDSILNLLITNKKNDIIGVLSIDSSLDQFIDTFKATAYIVDILSNFIGNLEESLLLIENETKQ